MVLCFRNAHNARSCLSTSFLCKCLILYRLKSVSRSPDATFTRLALNWCRNARCIWGLQKMWDIRASGAFMSHSEEYSNVKSSLNEPFPAGWSSEVIFTQKQSRLILTLFCLYLNKQSCTWTQWREWTVEKWKRVHRVRAGVWFWPSGVFKSVAGLRDWTWQIQTFELQSG